MKKIINLLTLANNEPVLCRQFRDAIVAELQLLYGTDMPLELYSGISDMLFKLDAQDWAEINIDFFTKSILASYKNIRDYGDLYE